MPHPPSRHTPQSTVQEVHSTRVARGKLSSEFRTARRMNGSVRLRRRNRTIQHSPSSPPPHFITKRRLIASLARPLFLHFVHSGIVLPLFDEDRSGERDGVVEFDGARVRQTKTGKRGADGGGPSVRPSVRRSGEVSGSATSHRKQGRPKVCHDPRSQESRGVTLVNSDFWEGGTRD